jgi:broad specificity phosphatase PhoE
VTKTVWIVRHGQRRDIVDKSWPAIADRVHDPPLTELGRWAAWRVGRRFSSMTGDVDAVYASPFLRAVETAAEITDELGTEVRLEPGLGEHRNRAWFDDDPDIRSPAALASRFSPHLNRWATGGGSSTPVTSPIWTFEASSSASHSWTTVAPRPISVW